jgi:hypothetical protein
MQNHSRSSHRATKQQTRLSKEKNIVKKLFDAFCQLSDPTQTVLVIGLLLLLGWLIANPLILVNLMKAILGLVTIRASFKEFL